MKKNYKNILMFGLVVVVVGAISFGIWYLAKKDMERAEAETKQSIPVTPAMVIKGLTLEQTSGNRIEWVLNSNYANIFTTPSDQIVFKDVKASVYGTKDPNEVYNVNSLGGTYYTKDEKINLEGDVVLSTSKGYTFYTDDALYDISKKKISTGSKVLAKGSANNGEKLDVDGKGLKGDIVAGDFMLMDRVTASLGSKLNIKSKQAMFNTKKDKVTFGGGVSAQKEKMTISGGKISVGYNNKGEMNDMNVEGNVVINTNNKKALCDHALIKANSDEIVLTGKPEFHSGSDIIVGEKIVFFSDTEEVFVSKVKATVTEKAVRRKK
jgi:LPS export ABC transporter protein LptC/lipopolysaccharide transport protein LptA